MRRNAHIVEIMKYIIQVFIDHEYSHYDEAIINRIHEELLQMINTGTNKEHKTTAYNKLFKPIMQFKMNSNQIEHHFHDMVRKYSTIQESTPSSNIVVNHSLDVRQEILRHVNEIKALLESNHISF
jgi:hypothetical protein